jgi:hypothetical protein
MLNQLSKQVRGCLQRPEECGQRANIERDPALAHSAAFRLLAMDVADEAILGQERLVGSCAKACSTRAIRRHLVFEAVLRKTGR